MKNKITVSVVFLMLLLVIENVNARQWEMNQHITREAFKLLQMSSPGSISEMVDNVDDLAVTSPSKNLDLKHLKCQKNIILKNYMQINWLLFKNNSETMGNNTYLNNQHTLMSENGFAYYLKTTNVNNRKNENNVKDKVFYYGKQFIFGELCGIVCSFGSLIITGPFLPNVDPWTGAGYVANIMSAGYIIGNSLGVYLSGNEKYHGSYFSTLIGSISGAAAGLYVFYKVDAKGPLCSFLVIGPPIGSIVGFNLSRKPRELSEEAFINYDKGMLKLSLSSVNVYYDYYNKPVLNVNLFQANF